MKPAVRILVALLFLPGAAAPAAAQDDMPGVVLEVQYTPAPRAQIAIWIEREDGTFVRTLALTEAVAYRGIGNRPGASQMNSGYRWPYGRREGVLPIWAARRAAAPNARPFRRVIFQNRTSEGLASRTSSDQSVDRHFCLSFNQETTKRDALDAVSCASVFTSDKGRFITEADVANRYVEPYEEPGVGVGMRVPLPLESLYPPRMDVTRCTGTSCYDHADVALYADHVREVMPEIDAITTATPPGGEAQSMLFSLPADFPRGRYALWLEINVEGDYNDTFNETTYPTPTQPSSTWDSWAIDYGYPYRGQPSLAFSVPFELDQENDARYAVSEPVGRSSWDVWNEDYGSLEEMAGVSDDPSGAPASGADRLLRSAQGERLVVHVSTLSERPEAPAPPAPTEPPLEPDPETPDGGKLSGIVGSADAGTPQPSGPDAGEAAPDAMEGDEGVARAPADEPDDEGGGVILLGPTESSTRAVGPIRELRLSRHPDELHSHEWIRVRFLAAESDRPLHGYEVRVSAEPIVDERTFLMLGRPAKNATESDEGAVSLMLPADIEAGEVVEGEIGDLSAETRYYVAVRAVDRLDRRGPISVARITTTKRTFATVTPCFVATAAYGTPLAREVGVLRRVRDRYLLSNGPGRGLVAAYYAHGEALAGFLREHPLARRAVHGALEPIVAALSQVEGLR